MPILITDDSISGMFGMLRSFLTSFLCLRRIHRFKGDNELVIQNSLTIFHLKSVMLELIIKIYYQINGKGKHIKKSHDTLFLYNSLESGIKDFINSEYELARERKADKSRFPEIEIVLAINEDIMRNFKYSGIPSDKNNSADEAFYKTIIDDLIKRHPVLEKAILVAS